MEGYKDTCTRCFKTERTEMYADRPKHWHWVHEKLVCDECFGLPNVDEVPPYVNPRNKVTCNYQ